MSPWTIRAAAWVVGAAGLRVLVVPAEACPALSADGARLSAHRAGTWLVQNAARDGTYLYEYDRNHGPTAAPYNEVRHAGVTMSLYQLAAAGDRSVLASADRALAYMRSHVVREGDEVAFGSPGQPAPLGASALMLAALAFRRDATGDPSHDALMRGLARHIVEHQRPDGSLLSHWDPATQRPLPGLTSRYYTGEAFWALTLLHNRLPGQGWDVPARAVATHLATNRDRVEGIRFPPWPDQWAAYGLAEMAGWGLDDVHLAYARSLAARFGFLLRAESQRHHGGVHRLVRGRQARGGGLGVVTEGLSSLLWLSRNDPRMTDLVPPLEDRLRCGAGLLAARQVRADDSRIDGAWFREGRTRMDDQQHALSGLLGAMALK